MRIVSNTDGELRRSQRPLLKAGLNLALATKTRLINSLRVVRCSLFFHGELSSSPKHTRGLPHPHPINDLLASAAPMSPPLTFQPDLAHDLSILALVISEIRCSEGDRLRVVHSAVFCRHKANWSPGGEDELWGGVGLLNFSNGEKLQLTPDL